MNTLTLAIFRKYTTPCETRRQSKLLLRLALEEIEEIYEDEFSTLRVKKLSLQESLAIAQAHIASLESQINELRKDNIDLCNGMFQAMNAPAGQTEANQ